MCVTVSQSFGIKIERADIHIHCLCSFHVCNSEPKLWHKDRVSWYTHSLSVWFPCVFVCLLAFQIISGYVRARFSSYPGIPTPRFLSVVSVTLILLGLTCMLRVCLYRKGAMEWEKRGVENISFRWLRKPECPEHISIYEAIYEKLIFITS